MIKVHDKAILRGEISPIGFFLFNIYIYIYIYIYIHENGKSSTSTMPIRSRRMEVDDNLKYIGFKRPLTNVV